MNEYCSPAKAAVRTNRSSTWPASRKRGLIVFGTNQNEERRSFDERRIPTRLQVAQIDRPDSRGSGAREDGGNPECVGTNAIAGVRPSRPYPVPRLDDHSREELEAVADRWHLARQEMRQLPPSCDVQQIEHDACRGWDDFTNEELSRFYLELSGQNLIAR